MALWIHFKEGNSVKGGKKAAATTVLVALLLLLLLLTTVQALPLPGREPKNGLRPAPLKRACVVGREARHLDVRLRRRFEQRGCGFYDFSNKRPGSFLETGALRLQVKRGGK